jgi:hypothetical protein
MVSGIGLASLCVLCDHRNAVTEIASHPFSQEPMSGSEYRPAWLPAVVLRLFDFRSTVQLYERLYDLECAKTG